MHLAEDAINGSVFLWARLGRKVSHRNEFIRLKTGTVVQAAYMLLTLVNRSPLSSNRTRINLPLSVAVLQSEAIGLQKIDRVQEDVSFSDRGGKGDQEFHGGTT